MIDAWASLFASWSWQALILLALTWVIVRVSRSDSPTLRGRIWFTGMMAVAVLPVGAELMRLLPVRQPDIEPLAYFVNLPAAVPTTVEVVQAPAVLPGPHVNLSQVLFAIWTAGFLWHFGAFCMTRFKTLRLRRAAWFEPQRQSLPVRIGYAPSATLPMLAGVFRPVVLLPGDIQEWTTEDERRSIILHEIAHFDRRDHYLVLIQNLLSAVFFFHPAVRYASRQISIERELACDESVLRAGTDSSSYAGAILKVAEHCVYHRLSPEPAFHSSRKTLERRIEMIFKKRSILDSARLAAATLVSVALLAVVMGYLLIPNEVTAGIVMRTPVLAPPELIAEPQQTVAPTAEAAPRQTAPPVPVQNPPANPPLRTNPDLVGEIRLILAPVNVALAAQTGSASLSGKVLDASGALVPGVSVKVKSATAEFTGVTDNSGGYTFPALPADTYRLEVSLPGFKTAVLSSVALAAGASKQQNFTLQLAPINTSVQVSAQKLPQPVVTPIRPEPLPTGRPPLPQRIGGDVAQANLIFQPKPQYPASVRALGIQDDVLISAIIGKDGTIQRAVVINLVHPDLAQAALESVQQWRYKPQMLNGQPTEVVTTITVSFTLTD